MKGRINENLALEIPFVVVANGTRYNPDAVISFQFLGELILPAVHVGGLQLNPKRVDSVELIDGSVIDVPVYEVEIEWHGNSKVVYVHALGDNIIIGVGLLFLNRLNAYFAENSRTLILPKIAVSHWNLKRRCHLMMAAAF